MSRGLTVVLMLREDTVMSTQTSEMQSGSAQRANQWMSDRIGMPGTEGTWRIAKAEGGLYMKLLKATVTLLSAMSAGWFYPWLKHYELGQWTARLRIDGRRIVYHGSVAAIYTCFIGTYLIPS